ncbi:hypothetical protein [Stenotrophomonas maltophilia]|uniref:hypothetical protein n=1 Tax=Stenotrophomonas maltophilia TaxID=40324 RepID=UPI00066BDCEF|nr:hypothetical protein [Stenotrophomonas maltophilia]MBH1417148.1 hypothetical protein [Stenotrophomonas maltophilia]MCU1169268.1 hypothetical protein [Stenotrophomonas maltophilia]MDZ5773272.1 hypothetical protein [Stenotrophomonas maltophilia]HDS1569302.1 hypothetical protein [Stenotrophomonas maltophilia]HDS1591417.1 hypothetical protein [Stenotrophomonas maltophilia]
MDAIEKRAREVLARMEKAKRNERGHWCDARAAVDSACDLLPAIIAALTPPEGYVLVEASIFDAMREFVTGFHGMSRNNAENLAAEILEHLNAARSEVP